MLDRLKRLLRGERSKFDRKKHLRREAHLDLARAKRRVADRRRLRQEAFESGRRDRANELAELIVDDLALIHNLQDQIDRLTRILQNTRDDITELVRRIRRVRRRRDQHICMDAGNPCWGGSKDIFWQEVVPAVGVSPHSTKRTETFGNPGSDHHVSQILAYAGDFPPSVSDGIAAARALGIGYNGYADDYRLYYINRDGRNFRVQIIAANHGTGPHLHIGIERVG